MSLTLPRRVCPQCWENGILLCRKMAEQYESYYDYRNLSKMRVRWRGASSSRPPSRRAVQRGAAQSTLRALRQVSQGAF